jgi:hypothetical protein
VHAVEGFRTALENRRMEIDDEDAIELWVFPQ